MERTTVAERIRARLDALNKNPSAVALEAGLSRSSVLDILKGKAANPRLDTLKKLTGPLECSLAYLTGDSEQPDQDKMSIEEYALLDTDIRSDAVELAAGVYREYGAHHRRTIPPTLVYRDPRHPQRRVDIGVMTDDSMAGAGILEGDQLTFFGDFHDIDIPLSEGSIVIAMRDLEGEARELSVREVEIVAGQVVLCTRPIVGPPNRIEIWSHEALDEDGSLPNYYLTKSRKSLIVEGVVTRITRVLPDPL